MGLLTANYNGEGTGAAALGVDTETDEVILGQAIDVAGLDADAFLETVETFVKYLTYWTEQLPTLGSPVCRPTVRGRERARHHDQGVRQNESRRLVSSSGGFGASRHQPAVTTAPPRPSPSTPARK